MGVGGHCGYRIPPVFASLGAGCSPETLVETWRSDSVVFGGGDFSANKVCAHFLGHRREHEMLIDGQFPSVQPNVVLSQLCHQPLLWGPWMGHPCGSSSVGGSFASPYRADLEEEESQGSSSYSNWLSPVGLSSEMAGSLSVAFAALGKGTGNEHKAFYFCIAWRN